MYLLNSSELLFLKKIFTGRNSYMTMCSTTGLDVPLWFCCAVRLLYYAVVAFVAACVMALIPRRRIPLLTRTGLRSLQVYFLHPFVYYALEEWGFASSMYLWLPKSAATFSLFASGVMLAIALGIPDKPQRVFDGMKRGIAKTALTVSAKEAAIESRQTIRNSGKNDDNEPIMHG